MPTIIYCPTTKVVENDDDKDVVDSILGLMTRQSNTIKAIHDGKADLGRLDNAAGSKLYIVGHGNAGLKIGAHGHENSTAPELVAQLVEEGLPKQPNNLICIHLYACCTATKVKKNYTGQLQEAFVTTFCQAMVKNGFSNFRVVAYVGILCGKDNTYSVNYHAHKKDKREWNGNLITDPLNVHYTINGGSYQKVGNDEWVQRVEKRWHAMRKSSLVFIMENQA